VPKPKSKSYWKKKCDKLFGHIIRASGQCAICGRSDNQLHCHHLITRAAVFYRHNLNNAVCLCASCHNFGFSEGRISAHSTPWAFEQWMKENKPEQYEWWEKNRRKVIAGVKIDYKAVYETLKGQE